MTREERQKEKRSAGYEEQALTSENCVPEVLRCRNVR